jgi:hypothetical protein
MVDLGIYNYIKNELAQGQPKESLTVVLQKRGMNEADIADAFASVESGAMQVTPLSSYTPVVNSYQTVSENNNVFSLWDEFRPIFWKYQLGIFVVGIIASIFRIGFISIPAHLVMLLLQIFIAITIGKAAKAFSGRSHVFLSIIGFFFPPAGYYYVYTIAKKNSSEVTLNIFEWIFVIVGLVGYFLFIIAVVGIVSVFVLANLSNSSSTGLLRSTSPSSYMGESRAIQQSDAASVKSSLDTIRTVSAIYTDSHNTYGSSSDCYSGGIFIDPTIVAELKKTTAHSPYAPVCRSNGSSFVVQQQYLYDNKYWCVDSTGNSVEGIAPIPANSFVCK